MTPDEIRRKFVEWKQFGTLDGLDDCIWNLLNDVIDSIRLAEGGTETNAGPVQTTVTDYLVNHYGD